MRTKVVASWDGKLYHWDKSTDGIKIEESTPRRDHMPWPGVTEDSVPKEGLEKDMEEEHGEFEAKRRHCIRQTLNMKFPQTFFQYFLSRVGHVDQVARRNFSLRITCSFHLHMLSAEMKLEQFIHLQHLWERKLFWFMLWNRCSVRSHVSVQQFKKKMMAKYHCACLCLLFMVPYWHSLLHLILSYTYTLQCSILGVLRSYSFEQTRLWCMTFQYLFNLSLCYLLCKTLPEIWWA